MNTQDALAIIAALQQGGLWPVERKTPMPEPTDVVVSQEDAQYIIERQRREIETLREQLQTWNQYVLFYHEQLVKRLQATGPWRDDGKPQNEP